MIKKYICCLFIVLIITSIPFPLFSESRKKNIILVPEYLNKSGENIDLKDTDILMKYLQDEVYKIFYHYSGKNAVKSNSFFESDNVRIIKTVLSPLKIIVSQKGGYFCETELSLFYGKGNKNFQMKYTGYGDSAEAAFKNAVLRIPSVLEQRYSDFDKYNGFYKILDIYQNEVILGCGKNDGFGKGDYLEIINSVRDKPEGRIILTSSDKEISYGRLLDWTLYSDRSNYDSLLNVNNSAKTKAEFPEPGTKVQKIKYYGFDTSLSGSYLFSEQFSGMGFNLKVEYFRRLYIFHPFAAFSIFNIKEDKNKYNLSIFSAGIAMFRYFKKMAMYSEASLCSSWSMNSSKKGDDFRGGSVKAGLEYSFGKHIEVFADAGFIQLFALDDADPDINGFLLSSGISFKY